MAHVIKNLMSLFRYEEQPLYDLPNYQAFAASQNWSEEEKRLEPEEISFMLDIIDPINGKVYARIPRVSMPADKASAKDILAKLTDFQPLFEGYEVELLSSAHMSRVPSAKNLSEYRLSAVLGPRKMKVEIYLPHSGGTSKTVSWINVEPTHLVSQVIKDLIPPSHPWLEGKKFRVLNKENLELLNDRGNLSISACRSLIVEIQTQPVFISYEEGKTIGGFKYGIMFEKGNKSGNPQEIIGDFRNPDKPLYYLAFEKKSDSRESFLVAIDRTYLDPTIIGQWDTYWIAQSWHTGVWENTTLMLAPSFIDTILKPSLLPQWYPKNKAVKTKPAPPAAKKKILPKSATSKAGIIKFPLGNENKISLWSKPNDYQWYGITKQA